MPRKNCFFMGLVLAASLMSGISFSQSRIDTTGARVDVSQDRALRMHAEYFGNASEGDLSAESAKQAIIIEVKAPLSVFDIVGLNVDQKSNGYLIRIHCTKQLPDFESWLKPIGDDTWLYVTLADAQANVAVLEDFKPTAFVKKVLVFQSETSVQLTFMLKGRVRSVDLIPLGGSQDILVAVFTPADDQLADRKPQ